MSFPLAAKLNGTPERTDATRAAVAAGVDALFLEVHPEPSRAPSDATRGSPSAMRGALRKYLK